MSVITHHKNQVTLDLEYHELYDECLVAGMHGEDGARSRDWHGGLDTQAKCLETLRNGSDYQLEESKNLLDQITDKLDLAGIIRESCLDVVGSLPCVPAYLSGSPMNMRRTVEVEAGNNASPITIYFGLVSSGAISAQDLSIRSCAILAFAQALSIARPVELVGAVAMGVGGMGEGVIRIRVGIAPVDLSALCALAHPGIQRGSLYGLTEFITGSTSHRNRLLWTDSEAKSIGVQPGDVFFKSPHYDDLGGIKRDPVKWVQDQLELALKGEGAAYTGERNDR